MLPWRQWVSCFLAYILFSFWQICTISICIIASMSCVSQSLLQLQLLAVLISRPNQSTFLIWKNVIFKAASVYVMEMGHSYGVTLKKKQFKDASVVFGYEICLCSSVSLKQISLKRQKGISACTNLHWKKEKVNKMDRVSGERLIRKVLLDYNCAADEINHVWRFPYARLPLWPTQT